MRVSLPMIAASCLITFGTTVGAAQEVASATAAPLPAPFVVKPYLQLGHVPAQGVMQLLWHAADVDANWSVAYQSGSGRPWQRGVLPSWRRIAVDGVEPHRIYRATLADLEPGGVFQYVVNKGEQPVFASEGRAVKSADQPYRFVAFGDCGAGSLEQKPLAHRAYLCRPDFVMIPGDIVYEYGLISDYREKFWPVYNADDPSESGVPLLRSTLFMAAPGNHDTEARDLDKFPGALAYYLFWEQPLNGPLGKEGGPFVPPLTGSENRRKAFTEVAGKAYPRMTNFSFDYGNAHWTIVDSNPYVDWTDRELRERSISLGSRGDPCFGRKYLPLKMMPASRLVVRT